MRFVGALVLCFAFASSAAANEAELLLLGSNDIGDLDENALTDAISIYTRDLRYRVVRGPAAPASLTAEALQPLAALVGPVGARLVLWCRVRPQSNDAVLYAISREASGPVVHALRVVGLDKSELYRALALKVRAVLTGEARLEANDPVPSLSSLPVAAPPRAVRPPDPAALPQAAAPNIKPVAVRPYRAQALFAIGYRLTLPLMTALLRHGVVFEVARPIGAHVEVQLALDIMTRADAAADARFASLFDLPIRVGVRGFLRTRRIEVGIGPVLSLHVLSVTGTREDGSRGEARSLAAGLGAELPLRVRLSDHVGAEARLLAEALVPRTRFLIDGRAVLDSGGVLFGLSAGLVFAAP